MEEHVKAAFEAARAFLAVYVEQAMRFYQERPVHFIVLSSAIAVISYILVFKRAYDPSKRGYGARGVSDLREEEKDELIAEWQPEPLVTASGEGGAAGGLGGAPAPALYTITEFVAGGRGVSVKIAGDAGVKTSFCRQDFLGLGTAAETTATATRVLEEYSLGSCGPRGFYGTTSKHLELEAAIAAFMGTEESITYSDAVATVASAIPAFAKRGDVLLVDAGVNHAVWMGTRLSRSKVVPFAHNDVDDLERKLEAVAAADRKEDTSLLQRRFIVVEGLYANYGDVCPLAAVVALARRFKWRVILDDSLAFGVLGASGHGATEAAGLKTLDVDVLTGSLSTTLGAVGGFCVGSREVVDHQRLSGAGYCFSASAPPFLCATATTALAAMTPKLLAALASRCTEVHAALTARVKGLSLASDPVSPVKHLRLAAPLATREAETAVLEAIVRAAAAAGVLLATAHYLPGEVHAPRPSLKLALTLAHTPAMVESLIATLARVVPPALAAAAAAAP